MTEKQAIKRWKDKGIQRCDMDFSCGGDSMNDWSFTFFDKDDKEFVDNELKNFFEDEVFKKVEFYVNSDGHYIGESGNVEITLNDEDDEDAPLFDYCKNSQSEWSETNISTMEITITPAMADYLKKRVSVINGSADDGVNFNYKEDFIQTKEEAEIEAEIEALVEEETEEYVPDNLSDVDDWFTFTTNLDDTDDDDNINIATAGVTIKGDKLLVQMRNQYTRYEEE